MYYQSRQQVGQKLAEELSEYRFENTAVIAISPGGVIIAAEIAKQLHCTASWLQSKEIHMPGDEKDIIGSINQTGVFAYNSLLSDSQINSLHQDYNSYIEQEKLEKLRQIHRLVSVSGELDPDAIRGHNIILISDGAQNIIQFDAALAFIKSIRTEKLIAALPIASIDVVDYLHIAADEIHIETVVDATFPIEHYYEDNEVPEPAELTDMLSRVVDKWIED